MCKQNCSTVSHLDIFLEKDFSGNLTTTLHDKRYGFNFFVVNFPYFFSNIPSSPTYGVYLSQLFRYARVCVRTIY